LNIENGAIIKGFMAVKFAKHLMRPWCPFYWHRFNSRR